MFVYIICDYTGPARERDRAFLSEELAYQAWIDQYAGDITDHIENLNQTQRDD